MKQEREQKKKKKDDETQREGESTPGAHRNTPARGQNQQPIKGPDDERPADIDEDEEETDQRRRA